MMVFKSSSDFNYRIVSESSLPKLKSIHDEITESSHLTEAQKVRLSKKILDKCFDIVEERVKKSSGIRRYHR